MSIKIAILSLFLCWSFLAQAGVQYFDLNDDQVEDLVEPSGVLYVPELGLNLLVSDETGDEEEASIFTMTSKGQVLEKHSITGSKKMSDLESITRDEKGHFYIMSSLSPKKNGEISKKRSRLLKFERTGESFSALSSVNFYKLLNQVAVDHPNRDWAQILLNDSEDYIEVDIEGMLVKDNNLYFGLRRVGPFKGLKDYFVMIRIKDIAKTLELNTLSAYQLSVHAKFPFPSENSYQDEGISDLSYSKGSLYILTVNNSGKKGGRLLKAKLNKTGQSIVELKRFVDLKPEGITYDSKINKLIITCDQGDETSRVVQLSL